MRNLLRKKSKIILGIIGYLSSVKMELVFAFQDPSYGKLDTDGAITDGYGDITWDFDANSYTYTPRQ